MAGKATQDESFGLYDPEPWHDAVSGDVVIDETVAAIRRFIVLPDYTDAAVALWCAFVHAHDLFQHSPRLVVRSPEKRCGKTTLLNLLLKLVPRPLPCSNITGPALFRTIELAGPTLLIDEADTFLGDQDDLKGILNSGHNRASASVIRLVGPRHEPMRFKTWSPVAIAAIRGVSDTLEDRSLVIHMRRRLRHEIVERLDFKQFEALDVLCRKLSRLAQDLGDDLAFADPSIPSALGDRAADNWRPLLAIADAVGGHWPETARKAAIVLSGIRDDDDGSAGVMLIADIFELFQAEGQDRMSSGEIVRHLNDLEGRPWVEWRRGQPMIANSLARQLKPFGIKPTKIRFGSTTANGYEIADFTDAFSRYCASPVQTGTLEQVNKINELEDTPTGTRSDDVPVGNAVKPLENNDCSGVPDETPGNGDSAYVLAESDGGDGKLADGWDGEL